MTGENFKVAERVLRTLESIDARLKDLGDYQSAHSLMISAIVEVLPGPELLALVKERMDRLNQLQEIPQERREATQKYLQQWIEVLRSKIESQR